MKLILTTIMLFIALLSSGRIMAEPEPTYVESDIQVDGVLDETEWLESSSFNEFTVVYPDNGTTPTHITDTRILYSDKGIYFAISNYQPFNTQVERLSARDISVERDSVQLVLDPSGNGLYGYVFTVGLGGSLMDGTVQPERQFAYEWNAPWQAKTIRYDDRWDAEVFIPWSALRLPEATAHRTMGLSIQRNISYLGEKWAIPAIGRNQNVFLSALLPVQFDVVEKQSELVFIPYLSTNLDRLTDSNDFNAGFDVYYQPSSHSQLALTVMPDFGQVENDDIVVNFSAFETFTPEKRTFFLEGQEIFKPKGERMVHTRRIGARPDSPVLSDGQEVASRNGFSDILAAGKYTGQTGNVRYGVMSAVEDSSIYELNDGTSTKVDGRNFVAMRTAWSGQNQAGQFRSVGYLGTLVEHFDDTSQAHLIDGEFRSADDKWQLDGQLYYSVVAGNKGYGQRLQTRYQNDDGDRHILLIRQFDRQLNLNEMGYLQRNDLLHFSYEYIPSDLEKAGVYKMRRQGYWLDYKANHNGQALNSRIGYWTYWLFEDLTRINFAIHYADGIWKDRTTRGNGAFRTEGFGTLFGRWRSDQSQQFSYGITGWIRHAQMSGMISDIRLRMNYAPTGRINFNATLRHRNDPNWFIWSGDTDRINAYHLSRINLAMKTTWIIDDNQELRLAIQWVGLGADARKAYRIADDGSLRGSIIDEQHPNFSRADLAMQLRYKYEFAPLSDLYLVYSRGGNTFDETQEEPQGFTELLSDSFDKKNADQFTVKVRYRF